MRETFGDQLDIQLNALFSTEDTGEVPRLTQDQDPYGFSVLMVCTGNICRSPLMEGLVRDRLQILATALEAPGDFMSVTSSGLGALVGSPADPLVLDLSRPLKTDLSQHRARQFESEQAESAHLILAASRAQRDEINELAPTAGSRCFTLAEFADLVGQMGESGLLEPPTAPLRRPTRISRHLQQLVAEANAERLNRTTENSDDVEDPYKQSPETHLRVAHQINQLCNGIASGFAYVLGVKRVSA